MNNLLHLIKYELNNIVDPEIPIGIYDLGLIYNVDINKDEVNVVMTLTSPFCPVATEMPIWVQEALLRINGINKVNVEVTFDPPWEPSDTVKLELGIL